MPSRRGRTAKSNAVRDDRAARVEALHAQIGEAVTALVGDPEWQAMLTTAAKFPRYSGRNQLLIYFHVSRQLVVSHPAALAIGARGPVSPTLQRKVAAGLTAAGAAAALLWLLYWVLAWPSDALLGVVPAGSGWGPMAVWVTVLPCVLMVVALVTWPLVHLVPARIPWGDTCQRYPAERTVEMGLLFSGGGGGARRPGLADRLLCPGGGLDAGPGARRRGSDWPVRGLEGVSCRWPRGRKPYVAPRTPRYRWISGRPGGHHERADRRGGWARGRSAGASRDRPQLQAAWRRSHLATAAVALVCMAAGGWAVWWGGGSQVPAAWWVLLVAGVALAVIDVREHRLPDLPVAAAAVGVLTALTAASVLSGQWQPWWQAIAVVAAAFALMYAMAMVTDLGYGDVKLIVVIAGCAGYGSPTAAALAVLAGFLVASIAAVTLLIVTRQASRALAMGPWLLLGAAAALAAAA